MRNAMGRARGNEGSEISLAKSETFPRRVKKDIQTEALSRYN